MRGIARRDLLAGAALTGAALAVPRADRARHARPWRVGCNFVPSTAVNQLEMWQAETFDPAAIDRELGFAEGLGMNAARVFLHDLVWRDDPDGFRRRIEAYLAAASRRGIATLFVLFDSCWDPAPRAGPQPAPRPGVHNSRWVQGPGAAALTDEAQWSRLEGYARGVASAFAGDARVLGWDVWNEPDNTNAGSYGAREPPDKVDRVRRLLPLAFDWVRAADPGRPLTSALWRGASPDALGPVGRVQVERSDVLSFHCYGPPAAFEAAVDALEPSGRPILCTEYMARPLGSTVEAILPVARRRGVAAFNWGLVAGRTQTNRPWDTWRQAAEGEPVPWFHDLLHPDGRPYDEAEAATLRRLGASERDGPASPARP